MIHDRSALPSTEDKCKGNPIIPEGLDLVLEEDQITHRILLEDELPIQERLSESMDLSNGVGAKSAPDVFKFNPQYLEHEERYKEVKAEIDSDEDGCEEGSETDDEEAVADEGIEDLTETNQTNLHRTIYLTIMNSVSFLSSSWSNMVLTP